MVNKEYIAINICILLYLYHFMVLVFTPKASKNIRFPFINSISLFAKEPNFCLTTIQLFKSLSTFSVRTGWGPEVFVFYCALFYICESPPCYCIVGACDFLIRTPPMYMSRTSSKYLYRWVLIVVLVPAPYDLRNN